MKHMMRHIKINPRKSCLIWPRSPRMQTPQGYRRLAEDAQLMSGEAFYVPSKASASWNKETPATRILVRADHFEQVRLRPPFCAPPAALRFFMHAGVYSHVLPCRSFPSHACIWGISVPGRPGHMLLPQLPLN
jgi:hypothetical protein